MKRMSVDSTLFRNFFRGQGTNEVEENAKINSYLEDLGRIVPKSTFRKYAAKVIRPDILIDNRYSVLEPVGSGAYGRVFMVMDKQEQALRALKMLRNSTEKDKYFSKREFETLFKINAWDANDESFIVRMTGAFHTGIHLGILFELLGPTVFDILSLGGHEDVFEMDQVKTINYQILKATEFLHNRNLIHHDIKTNNVAFVSGDYDKTDEGKIRMRNAGVRVIDLGSCTATEPEGKVITATTVQYRSPEMSLGAKWCRESDIWSVGCTFFEVYSGFLLFPCASETEKYYIMETVLQAKIPTAMVMLDGKPKLDCFDCRGTLVCTKETLKMRRKVKPLDTYKRDTSDDDTTKLFILLHRMLVMEPQRRMSAKSAVKHPFFENVQLPLN